MSKTQSYFNRKNDHYALEDGLARELQRRKIEEERKKREYERICA